MRFTPATEPSGLRTCQSPIQKSNCLNSGAPQGAGGAAWLTEAASVIAAHASRFMALLRSADVPRRAGSNGTAPGPPLRRCRVDESAARASHPAMTPSRPLLASAAILILSTPTVSAADAPALREADRVRLAEAFRIGDALASRVWQGWNKAPFAVLLVTPDREFLIRHPRPSPEFTPLGHDALLDADVYVR